jgi:uncharacterized protein with ATP-grasp and redox domains
MKGFLNMKMQLDCMPCFLRQALEASRIVTDDPRLQTEIMKKAAAVIERFESYRFPPEVGREVHAVVKRLTGVVDPYRQFKQNNVKLAEHCYPKLKQYLFAKGGGLEAALKIAAVGNNLDAAIYQEVTDGNLFAEELKKEFAVCDLKQWEGRLKTAKNLLIIGDNAGETVFDRILIEQLLYLEVTYVVRGAPIINDATVEDALAAGIGRHARIIASGCDAPGLILNECNVDFWEAYHQADLVLSKGQGNYETLSEVTDREIFFLLKAKCPVIASDLGVDVGSYIFKAGGR